MRKIDEIENKIFYAREKIKEMEKVIKTSLPELVDAHLEEKGLVKGKTIVTKGGEDYLVAGLQCTETGVAFKGKWLTGYKIKKDGTAGIRLTNIYDGWTVKE